MADLQVVISGKANREQMVISKLRSLSEEEVQELCNTMANMVGQDIDLAGGTALELTIVSDSEMKVIDLIEMLLEEG